MSSQDSAEGWFKHADASAAARVGVIAEIGVNHDGDVARAESLIEAAAEAGADAVKFQCFRPDRLLSAEAALAGYQAGQASDAAALLGRLTLTTDEMGRLAESARRAGLRFIVTPFSLEDVDDLAAIGVDLVKIASPDAVNRPLLEAVSAIGRPVLISTGTCEVGELTVAAGVARQTGGALLQCVSAYPTPEPMAALGGIAALRSAYDLPTGYSDHTPAEDCGALAVAAGACLLEKHLTYDRSAVGPDHAASLEPAALKRYIKAAQRAAVMVGPIAKTCGEVEADVKAVSRQSICMVADRPAGHVLSRKDLTVKRPGTGIPAGQLEDIIGRRLARPMSADRLLRWDDLIGGHDKH